MHSSRTLTANINNGLTSGKGPIADLERLNVYFWKVLKAFVAGTDSGRRLSTYPEVQDFSLYGGKVVNIRSLVTATALFVANIRSLCFLPSYSIGP